MSALLFSQLPTDRVHRLTSLSLKDALIVRVARSAGAVALHTESFNRARSLGGVRMVNPAILAKAVENYRRDRFLQQANLAFAALRDDPAAWSEEDEERRLWERTLGDGGEDR